MRLQGKSAIVTGAGTGIGKAIALAMRREGARVALVGRRREQLDEVAREIGGTELVCAGDVRVLEDIQRVVKESIEKFGGVDVLVNSAGVLYGGTAENLTEEQWGDTFAINVKAVWRMSREVLPSMRKAGGGSIVNISSVLGLIGARNRVAYSASKGAVTLMTKSMAMDHAHEQIRVNCICPGIVETEMVAEFIRNAPSPEEARKVREALHPLGRFGQPEDIAGLAVFLASDEARWITGAAMPVDGGYTAGKA
jgi:NAD(P)-dependent dehydrogenase (short-subunit alcohol dehydrogenase family)